MKKLTGEVGKNKRSLYKCNGQVLSYCDLDKAYGGLEEYPSPRDLFAFSIGVCKASVIAMFIEGKLEDSAEGIRFETWYEKAGDETVKKVYINFYLPKRFESRKEDILRAAEMCPLKRTVKSYIEIETNFTFE